MLTTLRPSTDGLWHRRRSRRYSPNYLADAQDVSNGEISVTTTDSDHMSSPNWSAWSPAPLSPASALTGCLMVASTCLSMIGSANASPLPSPTAAFMEGNDIAGGFDQDVVRWTEQVWEHQESEVVQFELVERADVTITTTEAAVTITDSTASSTSTSSSASSSTSAAATTSLPSAPTSALLFPDLSLESPQAFDTTLSYNLSHDCVSFFSRFLQDQRTEAGFNEVGGCLSWGLVMRTSSEWSQIVTNNTLLNAALSDICYSSTSSPGATTLASSSLSSSGSGAMTCSAWFSQLTTDIQKKSNCASDLADKNAVANQALMAFQNYDLMQQAACLKDADTGVYCYIQAVNTSLNDAYLYNLPVGTQLPSTATPTCSRCSQALLGVYANAINNGTSYAPILKGSLGNATLIVENQCGQSWVTRVTSSAGGRRVDMGSLPWSWAGLVMAGICLIMGWTI